MCPYQTEEISQAVLPVSIPGWMQNDSKETVIFGGGEEGRRKPLLNLLSQIIQGMMDSENSTQQKDWVPSRKLFLKNLKAAKSIGSLGIKRIILCDMPYYKSTLTARMQKG